MFEIIKNVAIPTKFPELELAYVINDSSLDNPTAYTTDVLKRWPYDHDREAIVQTKTYWKIKVKKETTPVSIGNFICSDVSLLEKKWTDCEFKFYHHNIPVLMSPIHGYTCSAIYYLKFKTSNEVTDIDTHAWIKEDDKLYAYMSCKVWGLQLYNTDKSRNKLIYHSSIDQLGQYIKENQDHVIYSDDFLRKQK